MDPKQLQSEHPDTYAAVLKLGRDEGHTAGVTEGTTAERKRCVDHLKLGKSSGDVDMAHKAIADGASVADMTADYLSARMNGNAIATRQEETDAAGAAADGAKTTPAAKTGAEEVGNLVGDLMVGKIK